MNVYLKTVDFRKMGFYSSAAFSFTIFCLMWSHPLIVEENTPLDVISEIITNDSDRAAVDDFLVVDGQGRYLGVGKVIDLLKEITQLSHIVRSAEASSPMVN